VIEPVLQFHPQQYKQKKKKTNLEDFITKNQYYFCSMVKSSLCFYAFLETQLLLKQTEGIEERSSYEMPGVRNPRSEAKCPALTLYKV
jgi:hypothetical protein